MQPARDGTKKGSSVQELGAEAAAASRDASGDMARGQTAGDGRKLPAGPAQSSSLGGEQGSNCVTAEAAEAPTGPSRGSPVGVLQNTSTPASSGDDTKAQQVPFKVLLTQEQALEIYRMRPLESDSNAKPTSLEVAERYGVSPKTIRDVWNRKTWVKVTRPLWEPTELETFMSEAVRRKPFAGQQQEGATHGEGEQEGDNDGPARARRPVREARNNKRQLLSPSEDVGSVPRRSGGKRSGGGSKRQKGGSVSTAGTHKTVNRPPPPSKAPPLSQKALLASNATLSQMLAAGACRPGTVSLPINIMAYEGVRGVPDAPDRYEPDGGMSYNTQMGPDHFDPWHEENVMLHDEAEKDHLDLGVSPSSPRNVDYPNSELTNMPRSRHMSVNNMLSVVDW